MIKKIAALLIATCWVVYVGLTGYVLWLLFIGETPRFLQEYTLGTNAGWITLGVALWVVTEWFREWRERS